MTRRLLYVAHPVAPSEEEISAITDNEFLAEPRTREQKVRIALRHNLERAMRWLSWLRRSFPETTFIAPWIASIMAGDDDSDPKQREAGLVDDCAVVERCDGIVLCGGRISSGMRREIEHGRMANQPPRELRHSNPNPFEVYDMSRTGAEPPSEEWTRDVDHTEDQRARAESGACPYPWVAWAACFGQ